MLNEGLLNDESYCNPKDAMNSVTTWIGLYLNKDKKVTYDRMIRPLDYIEKKLEEMRKGILI